MSKGLTEQQYLLLSQLAYANIADTSEDAEKYNTMTLGEVLDKVGKNKFKTNGGITTEEFNGIIDKINDSSELRNLTLKGYQNNNKSGNYDGFVGYAFEDNEGNSYLAFRGSESNTPEGQHQGKFGVDWVDNVTMGVNGESLQFEDVKRFVNMYGRSIINPTENSKGKVYVTGHSKGGANALYACAAIDGVTGIAFDAPGIDQALSFEERMNLIKSGVVNCVINDDIVGASLFHSEKRKFCLPEITFKYTDDDGNELLGTDLNGTILGLATGHYTQAFDFDVNGEAKIGQRTKKSMIAEWITRELYLENILHGRPLSKLVDKISLLKDVERLTQIKDPLIFIQGLENMLVKMLNDIILSPIKDLKELFRLSTLLAPPRVDPLTLDLDGDGIETVGISNGVYFDLDSNGIKEKTAWLGKDDGFLVYDKNGDGIINNSQELFGDVTKLQDGTTAKSGFMALGEFDENHDGKIDKQDSIYSKLRVWRDLVQDGISENNELFTLEELGIESIDLYSKNINSKMDSGTIEVNRGSYTKKDGSKHNISELLFERDTFDSNSFDNFEVDEEVLNLPNLFGKGDLKCLSESIMADKTGELRSLVKAFVSEKKEDNRHSIFLKILYKWTGCEKIDSTSRGTNIDAKKIAVIEKFFGNKFEGVNGANPNINAAAVLENIFKQLYDNFYYQLMGQSHLKEVLPLIYGDKQLEKITGYFDSVLANNIEDGKELLYEFVSTLRTMKIEKLVDIKGLSNYYTAKSNELGFIIDSIYKVRVKGTQLNDILNGGDGDDVLDGGSGNDYLEGKAGNDIYVYKKGYGTDTINNYDPSYSTSVDILRMEDIKSIEVNFKASIDDLIIEMKDGSGNVTIKNFYSSDAYKIDRIEFSDGIKYEIKDLMNMIFKVEGTNENEIIYGSNRSDKIEGNGGEDKLYGAAGDDILDGGLGNDYLDGGAGNDTYVFGKGYGQDIIDNSSSSGSDIDVLLMKDLSFNEVTLTISNTDLIIEVNGTKDSIKVARYFENGYFSLEKIKFVDGKEMSFNDVKEYLTTVGMKLYGTSENDTIKGTSQMNWSKTEIYGKEGNDSLYGGSGNNVLYG
ncbi:Hemolysin-type calcium-binding repeat-containing protein, partial [Clostridium cavendishii DSM 21758]